MGNNSHPSLIPFARCTHRIGRVPAVFLASIPVAVVAPQDAPYVWLLIFVFGLVINRFMPQPDGPERIGEQISG